MKHIIAGCRKRKRQSQNLLYREYYSYGIGVCYRYVHDEQEARSILNQGFLKVFNNIHKFDETKDFKPWFKTIIINTAINHVKKMNKHSLNEELDMELSHPAANDILSKIHFEELLEMVRSLSTGYRTVFNMFVIDGYSHQEISEKLGISVGASKSNLNRARHRLREIIQTKMIVNG